MLITGSVAVSVPVQFMDAETKLADASILSIFLFRLSNQPLLQMGSILAPEHQDGNGHNAKLWASKQDFTH